MWVEKSRNGIFFKLIFNAPQYEIARVTKLLFFWDITITLLCDKKKHNISELKITAGHLPMSSPICQLASQVDQPLLWDIFLVVNNTILTLCHFFYAGPPADWLHLPCAQPEDEISPEDYHAAMEETKRRYSELKRRHEAAFEDEEIDLEAILEAHRAGDLMDLLREVGLKAGERLRVKRALG